MNKPIIIAPISYAYGKGSRPFCYYRDFVINTINELGLDIRKLYVIEEDIWTKRVIADYCKDMNAYRIGSSQYHVQMKKVDGYEQIDTNRKIDLYERLSYEGFKYAMPTAIEIAKKTRAPESSETFVQNYLSMALRYLSTIFESSVIYFEPPTVDFSIKINEFNSYASLRLDKKSVFSYGGMNMSAEQYIDIIKLEVE